MAIKKKTDKEVKQVTEQVDYRKMTSTDILIEILKTLKVIANGK